jgi:glucosamine kinase
VQAVTASGPVALAGLARLVAEAEAAGDAVAADICDRAAAHLAGAVADVRHPEDHSPLVLGGSVIAAPQSAVGKRVRAMLSARFAGDLVATADGTVGAVWLAIRHASPGATEQELACVHRRLRH